MNTNTGQVYPTLNAARLDALPGEEVVGVSPEVAKVLRAGTKELARRRAKNKRAKASRKTNR